MILFHTFFFLLLVNCLQLNSLVFLELFYLVLTQLNQHYDLIFNTDSATKEIEELGRVYKLIQPKKHTVEIDKTQESVVQFVVTSGYSATILQAMKKAFNLVA